MRSMTSVCLELIICRVRMEEMYLGKVDIVCVTALKDSLVIIAR